MQRLDWLYQGPECNKDITTAEEFLIGKPLSDKPEEKRYFTPVFQESYSNPQNEIFTKIHEDPVFLMKKEEIKQRKELEDNPYKMKMLIKKIEEEVLEKLNKNEKSKKDRKHKKDKKRKRDSSYKSEDKKEKKHKKDKKYEKESNKKILNCSSSSEDSSRKSSYDNKYINRKNKKNDYENDKNLGLNELKGQDKLKKYYIDTNKFDDINKSNFGLVDKKGEKINIDNRNNLGPDENLYKNRMYILNKESELRKKKSNI